MYLGDWFAALSFIVGVYCWLRMGSSKFMFCLLRRRCVGIVLAVLWQAAKWIWSLT